MNTNVSPAVTLRSRTGTATIPALAALTSAVVGGVLGLVGDVLSGDAVGMARAEQAAVPHGTSAAGRQTQVQPSAVAASSAAQPGPAS